MKKWIYSLICLGYIAPSLATQQDSFLVTGEDLHEISHYDHMLEIPSFFSRVYPLNVNPNAILVPRYNGGFFVGLEGYWQSPFDNQLDFALFDPSPHPFLPSAQSTIRAIDPTNQGAFGAYIGYVYPYTGRDVRLDAYFSSTSNKDSVQGQNSLIWAPLGLYDRTVSALSAFANQRASVDQVRLMTGEQISAGSRLRLRPALGVKGATLNRELTTNYRLASTFFDPLFGDSTVEEKNRFTGAGPAVEIDGKYFFTPQFGLFGCLTNAILVGSIRSRVNHHENLLLPSLFPNHFFPANTTINQSPSDRAVPNIEGKLGVFFEHPFCGSLIKLDVELGYDFNHFFKAVDTFRSTAGVINTLKDTGTTIFSPFFTDTPWHIKNRHDLTVSGPYLSIGLSGIACPNNAVIDPICVTVPRLEGGFVFGIGINSYRFQSNQRDFALLDPRPDFVSGGIITNTPLLIPSTNASLKNLDARSAFGGSVNLGYIFSYTPYDVTFHYEHSQNTHEDKIFAPHEGTIWTLLAVPFFNPFESRIHAREAKAHLKFDYDEAHMDVGQSINADSLVWLRVFEGVQYASFKSDFTVDYFDVTTIPLTLPEITPINFLRETVFQNSFFSGFGPRFGFDVALPFGGFALSSELAGGLLAGNGNSHFRDAFGDGFIHTREGIRKIVIPAGELGTEVHSETHFSPFVDLKLGLALTSGFFNTAKWTFEIGYHAAHYFNAITSFRHVTNNAAVFVKQVDDVTIDGPYINLNIFGFGACQNDCLVREPYCAFVPVLRGGFELAIEGLYIQPHAANLDFGITDNPQIVPAILPPVPSEPNSLPISPVDFITNPSGSSRTQVLTPGYKGAYRFHAGYIFPLTANDVSLNFVNFSSTSSQTVTAPPLGVIWTITNGSFGAPLEATLFPVAAKQAAASVDFRWRTADLEFGSRVKFYNLMMRFFGGIAHARVVENITINYLNGFANNPNFTPIAEDTITQDNNFSGWGPRLGLSSDLAIDYGFSLVSLVATDLLVGQISSSLTEVSSSGNSTALDPTRRRRLVPSLDAKLGLAYTLRLVSCLANCSQFSLEFGYEVNHYFNVKDSLRFTDYASTFIKQNQDISFNGPYARIQVNF
jgi:hypothetical protein